MKKLRILVSLTTNDNDYQIEQAKSAEETSRRLNIETHIVYAENDAINQSTQLLRAIQAAPQERPDAIVFEPVGGTALPQVAKAAVGAKIGWAVLNREASYIAELRLSTKPANLQVTTLKAQWTEESSLRSVRSWLKLTTSQKAVIDLISAQDDAMAMGARKAFQEITNESERDRWLKLPFTGCDGLPKTGYAWVLSGLLAATVFAPPNSGQAIEMLHRALTKGQELPERALTAPSSVPPLAELKPKFQ